MIRPTRTPDGVMRAAMPTKSQLHEESLRARIRQKVHDGALPLVIPETIQAGYGFDCECSACGQPITSEEIEYEIAHSHRAIKLSLHRGCYVLWQIECVELRCSGERYQ